MNTQDNPTGQRERGASVFVYNSSAIDIVHTYNDVYTHVHVHV